MSKLKLSLGERKGGAPQSHFITKLLIGVSWGMRLTVNLDPDVYDFTSAYAGGRDITLSAAISELIRRAKHVPETSSGRLRVNEHGYLVIAGTGDVITPAMVKKISEDELG